MRLRGLCLLVAISTLLGCRNSVSPVAPPPTTTTVSGIEMVQIPAGYFEMGSRSGREDEQPIHRVWIESFLMDKYEVTQAVFAKIGKDEALADPSRFKGPDLPVEQIKWSTAALFCNARSRFEGLQPCYDENTCKCNFEATGYRLPTEAEWEYACRAGTTTNYSFGHDPQALSNYAWYADNSEKKTHPVGQKQANPWGLHDLHGNVAEWCQDIYAPDYYRTSPEKNPPGPADGKEYVLRGGSWKSPAQALRSSARLSETPGFSDACLARDAIGFRCVRKAP